MNLINLGWSEEFARQFSSYRQDGFTAGRITLEHKNLFQAATEAYGEIPALATGKLLYDALTREDLPVVGDWVVLRIIDEKEPQATIHAVLPRKSKFSRRAAGRSSDEQPVAVNIDIAFLLTGLDNNYNLRRIERYLLQTRESGVQPVILLTKADIYPDLAARIQEVEKAAGGAPVHAISAITGEGLHELDQYLQPGITVALLGSSGVGKSTLLNHLLGAEVMRTQDVRTDDSHGRHTTTHRQLFQLPGGAALIDTPGMRELQLWGDTDGILDSFPDIAALARRCRFNDCQHGEEPGCAIQAALKENELDGARWRNYQKMLRELQFIAAKTDKQEELAIKQRWKEIHKSIKNLNKQRER